MANTREKLIELLDESDCNAVLTCKGDCSVCQYDHPGQPCSNIRRADFLIANGVTVGGPLAEFLHPVDDYHGLKAKYLVFKADTGERVADCFVLRPAKDPAAVEALRTYANATDNEALAGDIYNWVGEGVTVQKWVPVAERLPALVPCNAETAYSEAVNVLTSGRKVLTAIWDGSDFIADAEFWEAEGEEITHWTPVLLPLPEPPKNIK